MTEFKDNVEERVERRVDELLHEFFTECPYGRKAASACPALGDNQKKSSFFADYASQFFNECPYGRRATNECPYGRELAEKKKKKTNNKHTASRFYYGRFPEYVDEFFTECPYGKRVANECPYGREIVDKAHKKAMKKSGRKYHHQDDYAKEFFTECPYGRRATEQCPYGREIASKSRHPDYAKEFFTECPYGRRVANECPYARRITKGSKGEGHGNYHDYVEEFFTECPYGRRATEQCPYGREIVDKKLSSSDQHQHNKSSHPDYLDQFFIECPYGHRVAEECPYGHKVLEKAGIQVPPLKKSDDETQEEKKEPAKCPFADSNGSVDVSKCPMMSAAASNNDKNKTDSPKCPVGGVLPQSEKCPLSPNYKITLTPVVDVYETDVDFKFYVELPGVHKEDMKVEVKDNILKLTAEVKTVVGEEDKARFKERKFGIFSRVIPLHSNVAVEKIEAKLENGILTITAPKGVPSVTKSITIN